MQKELARHTYRNWKCSIFNAAILPIDLMVRWWYLPVWTVVDFISQDRRVGAALLIPPGTSADTKSAPADISIVETHNKVYFKANAPEMDGKKIEQRYDRPFRSDYVPEDFQDLSDAPHVRGADRFMRTSGLPESCLDLDDSELPSTPARWRTCASIEGMVRESI